MKIPNLRRGITAKLFWITTGLLIATTLILYLLTYLLLPHYYYVYKRNHLQVQVRQIAQEVKGMTPAQASSTLDNFALNNSLRLILSDNKGIQLYPSPALPQLGASGSMSVAGGNAANRTASQSIVIAMGNSGDSGVLSAHTTVTLNGEPPLTMTAVATLQPISEASRVLLLFLPYMFLIALMISIAAAFVYSVVVTRPLLNLNNIAKRMAQLDFATVPKLDRNDEIGELSVSLNGLATNLQQTLAELQGTNRQLKNDIERERELEAQRREFVATISHELKSPLTAVLGQLEAMIGRIGVYKNRDKYLRQSYGLMKAMEKLVYEILETSRMDRPDFAPQVQPIDLQQLVSQVIEDNAYLADDKHMTVQNLIIEIPQILADEKLLTRSIQNIFVNALQYSPKGSRVSIDAQTLSDSALSHCRQVALVIENTGVHIEKTLLDKVFHPFYRIEKSRSRQTGGSGLGLYIVKRNLDAQQIPYRLENTKQGVRFTLWLKQA